MTRTLAAALLLALASCGSILNSTGSVLDDTSKEYEPPPSWEGGIQFHFADSAWHGHPRPANRIYGAEVRFHDGRRERVVTGDDLFFSSANAIQTPWYRLWLPEGAREVEPTLRVIIGDRDGNRTEAQYEIRVLRDAFHRVSLFVYTPGSGSWTGPRPSNLRSFDVPPGAKLEPTDSLHISHSSVPRSCFNCP